MINIRFPIFYILAFYLNASSIFFEIKIPLDNSLFASIFMNPKKSSIDRDNELK